ncbi:6-bladed beta-propeller [Melioribacteraceae bacterium 4301-Me]|uniref:YncE family protein n=1 Tax=Pyranulibacter aquaticus TaxID=3163344 RepID=UPI003598B2A1
MIKSNYLLSLLIFLIFFVSCNKSENKHINTYNNYNNININLIRTADNFGNLFKLEKQISLTGKLIGSIQKLKYLSSGDIYIIDAATKHLNVFNSSGKFLRTIGGIGEGPGEYLTANDFVIDDSLNIYILDGRLRRVTVFDANGNLKRTIKINDFGEHMIIAKDQIYLYSSMNMGGGEAASCYDLITGHKMFEFAAPTSFIKMLISNKYVGVVLDCNCLEYFNNKIYVINPLQYAIRIFDLSGKEEKIIYGKSDNFQPIDASRKVDRANPLTEYVKSLLNNIRINNSLIIISFISFVGSQKPSTFLDFYTLEGVRLNSKSIICPDQFPRISFFPMDIDKEGYFYGYTQPSPNNNNLPNPVILMYKFLAYEK